MTAPHPGRAPELGDYLDSYELLQLAAAVPALLDELRRRSPVRASVATVVTAVSVRPSGTLADALSALSRLLREADAAGVSRADTGGVAGLLALLETRSSGRVPVQGRRWPGVAADICAEHREDACPQCVRG